jgi:hypothetical protein
VYRSEPKTSAERKGEWEVELLDCARDGDVDRCEALLKMGANVDSTDSFEMTPLHWTSVHGHLDLVKLLLAAGADLRRLDEQGLSALEHAAGNDHVDLCKHLIAAGLPLTGGSPEGFTLLHAAVGNGNVEFVKYLMERGAKSSVVPPDAAPEYLTPFQRAVKLKKLELVLYMQMAGNEDMDQRTVGGRTLIQLAGKGKVGVYLRACRTEKSVDDGLSANFDDSAQQSVMGKEKRGDFAIL